MYYLRQAAKRLHWYSKLLLIVGSFVIFLLLLEGISTLLMGWIRFPPVFLSEFRLEGNFIRDFDIGYVNKPNTTTEFDSPFGKCRCHINSDGLRNDYEVNSSKSKDEYRILCIGDSTVFGVVVDQNYTFPAQLESILNERNNGTYYTVLNAGCPCYSSFQVMRFIETRLHSLNPDMIIISVGVNDAKLRDSEKSRDYRNGPLPSFRRLIFKTNTYLIISYVESQFAPIKEVMARNTPAVNPSEYTENLNNILDMADNIGASVVFCPISVPAQYRDELWDIAKARNVTIVDAEQSLLRAYQALSSGSNDYAGIKTDSKRITFQMKGAIVNKRMSPDFYKVHGDNWVMIDLVHPNPIGYRAIAEDLAKVIP